MLLKKNKLCLHADENTITQKINVIFLEVLLGETAVLKTLVSVNRCLIQYTFRHVNHDS